MGLLMLMKRVGRELAPLSAASRLLYTTGAAWLVIGALHVIPLAGDQWNWAGAVSWRKPIVFGLSIGLLLATIGWVIDRIPIRGRSASVIAWILALSSSVEVALISIQTWRGRASHFNVLEGSDAAIFGLMGAAVGFMSLCLLTVFVWSMVKRPAEKLVRIAVIGGLALVVAGLGLGQWIIELGSAYVERVQAVPDTVLVGEAGVAKFPHALALHGIQVFILYAILLQVGDRSMRKAARMYALVGLYSMSVILVSAQTIAGYAPMELTLFSIGFVLCLSVSIVLIWAAVRASLHDAQVKDRITPVDMLSG
jgi:hypothetical protein